MPTTYTQTDFSPNTPVKSKEVTDNFKGVRNGTHMASGVIVPIGGIVLCGFSGAPANMLECNGGTYSRVQYPDLFTAIGSTFGSVNGTIMNLPNITPPTSCKYFIRAA